MLIVSWTLISGNWMCLSWFCCKSVAFKLITGDTIISDWSMFTTGFLMLIPAKFTFIVGCILTFVTSSVWHCLAVHPQIKVSIRCTHSCCWIVLPFFLAIQNTQYLLLFFHGSAFVIVYSHTFVSGYLSDLLLLNVLIIHPSYCC